MKVVLFCGGMGMRLKNQLEIPKPLVKIGTKPILWHIMKYYSFYGINEFILCLGYKASEIKHFFLNSISNLSHDFLMTGNCHNVTLFNDDIADWKISFIDTGLHSTIGQRLKAVESHLAEEEVFMANYADVLTDLSLMEFLECFQKQGNIASFLGVRPCHTFHIVSIEDGGYISSIQEARKTNFWINGGYFIFRREFFRYLEEGEDLVEQPFQRLIKKKELMCYKYDGFWGCMDTFKDKQQLEDLYNSGQAPWEVWKRC